MNKDFALRRTILTAMKSVGHAELHEIAAALGPDWLTPQKRASLRQMLRLMEKERLVMRMRVGVFRALAGRGWGGLGTSEEIVQCISACLRECDGVMRLDDVVRDFVDHRIWGPNEWDDQTRRILNIIREASPFRLEGENIRLVSERPTDLVGPPVAAAATVPAQPPVSFE